MSPVAILSLSLSKALTPSVLSRMLAFFGSYEALWNLKDSELNAYVVKARRKPMPFEGKAFLLRQAERVSGECEDLGIKILTWGSENYPVSLSQIDDAPLALYLKGKFPQGLPMTAVVGTREAETASKLACQTVVRELVASGHHIVSGLAFGIDACAHQACLEVGGTTTAVLAGGVETPYPYSHRKLYEQILEQGGGILSEYQPGTEPLAFQFPLRNRIISGLSERVLMMQAASRSGALITTTYALEQGKEIWVYQPEVMTERFAGNQKLISDGASRFKGAKDILTGALMSEPTAASSLLTSVPLDLPSDVKPLATVLSVNAPKELREIAEALDLTPELVFSKLMKLLLLGHVKELPGNRYVLLSI